MPPDCPRVTVVTCGYNGTRTVASAIESILGQAFTDFEYILVDDFSADDTAEIMTRYAERDSRVRVIRSPVNLSPAGALNRALQESSGTYWAVLDQDDISLPGRLERQVEFLNLHAEVGAVGGQAIEVDTSMVPLRPLPFPEDPALVRWEILFRCPILHSALMMRRELLLKAGGYPLRQWSIIDFTLHSGLIRTTRIANLPEVVAYYRRSPTQVSCLFRKEQLGQELLLVHAMLAERLGMRVPLPDIARLIRGVRGEFLESAAEIDRTADLLCEMLDRHLAAEQPDEAKAGLLRRDCAWKLLVLARAGRCEHSDTPRSALRQSISLDPGIPPRPRNPPPPQVWP